MKKLVVIISLMFTSLTQGQDPQTAEMQKLLDDNPGYYLSLRTQTLRNYDPIKPQQTKPKYLIHQPAEKTRKPLSVWNNGLYAAGKIADTASKWAWAPAFIGLVGMTYAYGLPVVGNFGLPSLLATGFLKVFRDNFNFSNDSKTRIEKRPYTYNGKEMEFVPTDTRKVPLTVNYTLVHDNDFIISNAISIKEQARQQRKANSVLQESDLTSEQREAIVSELAPREGARLLSERNTDHSITIDTQVAGKEEIEIDDFLTRTIHEEVKKENPKIKPYNVKISLPTKYPQTTFRWQFVVPPHKTFPAKEYSAVKFNDYDLDDLD